VSLFIKEKKVLIDKYPAQPIIIAANKINLTPSALKCNYASVSLINAKLLLSMSNSRCAEYCKQSISPSAHRILTRHHQCQQMDCNVVKLNHPCIDTSWMTWHKFWHVSIGDPLRGRGSRIWVSGGSIIYE
jgi:hypothetical protein